jgi:hypothetical protein
MAFDALRNTRWIDNMICGRGVEALEVSIGRFGTSGSTLEHNYVPVSGK